MLVAGILQVVLPFIYVPKNIHLEMPSPHSEFLAVEYFPVPAATTKALTYSLSGGDDFSILLSVTSEKEELIDFSVNDSSTTYLSRPKTSGLWNFVWAVPSTKNYTFVFDNSFSIFEKLIHFQLTKNSIIMESRDFTVAGRLLPLSYAYLGGAVILVGAVLIVFGVIRKTKPLSPTPLLT